MKWVVAVEEGEASSVGTGHADLHGGGVCVCIFVLGIIVFPQLARVYSVSSSVLSHWVLPNLWDNGSNVAMSFPFYKR